MTNQDNNKQDNADPKISNSSSVADENMSILVSPPVVVQQRRESVLLAVV
jgi:hypothetical protein